MRFSFLNTKGLCLLTEVKKAEKCKNVLNLPIRVEGKMLSCDRRMEKAKEQY